jgi:hypothetical protein
VVDALIRGDIKCGKVRLSKSDFFFWPFLLWGLSSLLVYFFKQSHHMKITHFYLFLIIGIFTFACDQKNTSPDPRLEQPAEFKQLLDAHGDWKQWLDAKAFSFAMIHETTLTMENHFVNLDDRKVRIDGQGWQIGYDGDKAWISPRQEAFQGQSVRFYHSLYYNLLSVPYIFTDHGVTVSKTENKLVNGQSYEALEVSFNDLSDRPVDDYYMLIDPETGKLAWLLYRVTFFDKNNTHLNALKYEDYRKVDGLAFPRIMTGYSFANDSTQQITYQVTFSDILLVDEPIDDDIFAMPKNGAVEAK